jgi:hypothetical protein
VCLVGCDVLFSESQHHIPDDINLLLTVKLLNKQCVMKIKDYDNHLLCKESECGVIKL